MTYSYYAMALLRVYNYWVLPPGTLGCHDSWR